jgi:hypothetical protein
MYIQALLYTLLFNALLATPVAHVHDFLICPQSTYAEIEYYFFYFFVNISEAVILYLPECKMILI